jgi:NADH dehydrogenase/NADH:ubiquinone oxidoreductase subunit G
MALKAVLASIDEVDEKYRDLYTQRGDKWEFTGVEGLKTQADVDRQLAANQKVRTDLTAANTALKAANDKLAVWEDLDPEDVKVKLEKLQTFEAGGNVPELLKNFDVAVNTRVQQVVDAKVKAETNKLTRQLDEAKTKLNETAQLVQTFETKDTQRTIQDAVRAAAAAAKVLPEAVGDLLIVAAQDLKVVDGKVQTEDGRDATTIIDEYKQKRPYFWPKSVGAGGTGGNEGLGLGAGQENPFSRKGWNMTKAGEILRTNPAQAQKLAEAAGVPKNGDGTFKFHVMPPAADK